MISARSRVSNRDRCSGPPSRARSWIAGARSAVTQSRPAGRSPCSIDDLPTALPAGHGAAVDAELARQRGAARRTFLDIGAGARRGRRIGVRLEIHQPLLPPIGRRQRRGRGAGARVPTVPHPSQRISPPVRTAGSADHCPRRGDAWRRPRGRPGRECLDPRAPFDLQASFEKFAVCAMGGIDQPAQDRHQAGGTQPVVSVVLPSQPARGMSLDRVGRQCRLAFCGVPRHRDGAGPDCGRRVASAERGRDPADRGVAEPLKGDGFAWAEANARTRGLRLHLL